MVCYHRGDRACSLSLNLYTFWFKWLLIFLSKTRIFCWRILRKVLFAAFFADRYVPGWLYCAINYRHRAAAKVWGNMLVISLGARKSWGPCFFFCFFFFNWIIINEWIVAFLVNKERMLSLRKACKDMNRVSNNETQSQKQDQNFWSQDGNQRRSLA